MKIAIFGIGAIGSVISMSLEESNKLFYFNRSSKTEISILRANKIKRRNIELTRTGVVKDLDWLIVCLKAYHFAEAEKELSQLITAKTKIAVIRNGLDLKAPFLKYTSDHNILECIIDCPTQKENRIYHQLRTPKITVAESKLASDFEKLFLSKEVEIFQVLDFKTKSWEKLIESSVLGAILCLTGETCHIFKDEAVLDLYEKLVDEIIEVAKADGAKIPANFKQQLIQKLKSYPDSKSSSMLTDRINGNVIEVEAKNGIISQLAKKYGLKTELNDMMTILLKKINCSK